MSLNMILSLALFFLSIAIPFFVVIIGDIKSTFKYVPELLLKYALFFNVGCLFIAGFMGQLLYGHEIAACLGWSWSPFQYELAFSELCLGVLGLISPIFGREFWLATVIGSVIWLLGGSGVHLYYLIFEGNTALLEVSFVIGWNICLSLWLIGLYAFLIKLKYHGDSLTWSQEEEPKKELGEERYAEQ